MLKRIIYLNLLLLFTSRLNFSQSDFKLSSEGYSFKSLNSNEVMLKIYLTASSLGSLSSWSGDTRNFELYSERSQRRFILKEFTPVLNINSIGTMPLVLSLTYVVPKDAENIFLKVPKRYNGFDLKIYERSYNNQIEDSKKKNTLEKIEDYIGLYFAVPYQLENVNSMDLGKSVNHLGIGIGVLPVIKKFGKTEKTVLFGDLKVDFNFALAYKLSDFSKLYSINASGYQVSERFKDSSKSKNFIYSAGFGISHKLGFINPIVSVSAALLDLKFNDITIHDLNNERKFNPGFTAWGYRIDIGLNFSTSIVYLGYSFSRFSPKTNIDLFNKPVIYNSIQFGVKGFGI